MTRGHGGIVGRMDVVWRVMSLYTDFECFWQDTMKSAWWIHGVFFFSRIMESRDMRSKVPYSTENYLPSRFSKQCR